MHRRYAPHSNNAIVSHQEVNSAVAASLGCFWMPGDPLAWLESQKGVDVIYKTPYGTWRVKVKFRSVVVATRRLTGRATRSGGSWRRSGSCSQQSASRRRLDGSPFASSPTSTRTPARGRCRCGLGSRTRVRFACTSCPPSGRCRSRRCRRVQIEQFLTELAVSRDEGCSTPRQSACRGRLQVTAAATVAMAGR